MKYFYILGNICSILGFIAALYQISIPTNGSVTGQWLLFSCTILTIAFWIYFYLKPDNIIARIINSRVSGKYYDTNNQEYDIIEGEFAAQAFNNIIVVTLPPFEKAPTVELLNIDKWSSRPLCIIENITLDSFTVLIINNIDDFKCKWRARGKLLNKRKEKK